MITKVVLAKLSPTMEEGAIVKWNKNEGDTVKVGDVLAEIETDKANMEMEALGAGVLRKVLVPAGGKAPVGSLIGVIAEIGEDISALLTEAPAAAPATAPQAQASPATPAAPSLAPPPEVASPPGGRIKASPLARAMARSLDVPLSSLRGTGAGGRIIRRDIENRGAPSVVRAVRQTPPTPADAPKLIPGEQIPLSNMRRTIARRLSESLFTAPHFYVTVEIDMGPAVTVRQQLAETDGLKVSFNDLVVKACARALARFPMVNASWTADAIVTHRDVHIGVAVALPDGLITPVVRNADQKTVAAISAEIKDLAARAKDKRLKPDEYQGSTFTISNLGMFDVTEFTAIINTPDSAILAVGAVRKVPVVVNDALAVGHRMKVTMSSDHRVIDGALAAQFLVEVRRLLENPISLFV